MDETFDHSISFSVLFYLSEEGINRALREIIRVTKTGGTIFIGDINDCEKYDIAMKIRAETHKNQVKNTKYSPKQSFICKSTIEKIANDLKVSSISFLDEESTPIAEYYSSAKYRFSVYIVK